ncbi:SDR family oxidoreductase [Pannonibacter tanglangensis]|uniref:SDR family oxidoreductase n=1 Tax=Pannonibacter tanglangensis TaxID=2750084 RepID=A0ABW9ZFN0_9HYPH|nr:SDR family oxidoreductase [Pannonibacter sp. XCT-34]NBN62466.1 SDR family oxidoreductase [Pannonibacter sp. XCT-34]
MQLKDKVIILTGASSGIGAAAARLFSARGARLVIGARRKARLDALAGELAEAGGEVVTVAGDVVDDAHARALVEAAVSRFGRLDGAFNNAGIVGDMVPLPQMSPETWNRVLEVNLTSAFHLARHQIPAMLANGGKGSIVFTSTFVGHGVGLPGMAAYAAAKSGLIGLTQVLAAEHGPAGLRVNALLPGGTMTEMAPSDAGALKWIAGLHALKRIAEPEEIAAAAAFLLSDDASFVTGSAMFADGGNSICKT